MSNDKTQLLRLNPSAGPKQYIFQDPDTKRKFLANDKLSLVKAIVAYRAANGLEPIQEIGIVLDHYWATLPENKMNAEINPEPLRRGLYATLKGGMVLLEDLWMRGQNRVNQQIANERAKQCSTCKFNVFPNRNHFIEFTDIIAKASIGDSYTPHDELLGNCEVCSCVNRVKVWYKGPFKSSKEEITKFEEVDCWQLKNLKGKL